MMITFFLLLIASAALSEKPIHGRSFSRPLFLRQAEAPVAAPYPSSDWKPQGQRLILPARQEAGVPHTVYGPPLSEAPPSEYGPPAAEPESTEAPEYPPSNKYGPPNTPQEPTNEYGPPDQEPLGPEQQEGYPVVGGLPGESPNNGYDYPQPQEPFPDPTNEYGPPQSPQQPTNEYGPPAEPAQSNNQYGAPGQAAQEPDNGYGRPPQETGQIPVEQGASERLRQKLFIQQLPGFAPSRFVKPQSPRLRQSSRLNQIAPQKLQQLPQRNQQQKFRPTSSRLQTQNQQTFQRQRVQPQRQQFAQKQQLYQTPQSAAENPNIAVATAVSGEYYVIEPNGRLQRVSFTTKNGKLVQGKITNGIKFEPGWKTNSPVYKINEFSELVRINKRFG